MNKILNQRLNSLVKKSSKTAFANKCGIKQTTMSGYLNGTSEPNLENLGKIARANGLSVSWLIGEDKRMTQGLSLDRHKEIGRELKIMSRLIMKLNGEFYSSYPHEGELARPLKEIAKAMEAIIQLKHYAEENMREDVDEENFDANVYSGAKEYGDSLILCRLSKDTYK